MPRSGKTTPLQIRGKLWVDIGGPAMTDAGADLLEQIDVCGSLSEAARRLHYSYRRAWLLVDSMNRRWHQPLVKLSTGGKKGGGATLTEVGRQAVGAYRDLQLHFQHFLDTATRDLHRNTR